MIRPDKLQEWQNSLASWKKFKNDNIVSQFAFEVIPQLLAEIKELRLEQYNWDKHHKENCTSRSSSYHGEEYCHCFYTKENKQSRLKHLKQQSDVTAKKFIECHGENHFIEELYSWLFRAMGNYCYKKGIEETRCLDDCIEDREKQLRKCVIFRNIKITKEENNNG